MTSSVHPSDPSGVEVFEKLNRLGEGYGSGAPGELESGDKNRQRLAAKTCQTIRPLTVFCLELYLYHGMIYVHIYIHTCIHISI